jgi:hypothetical protein
MSELNKKKKNKIDDSIKIELACNIAHHILMEYVKPDLQYFAMEDSNIIDTSAKGIKYTDLGQDLFNPIYDTIENMITEHFNRE